MKPLSANIFSLVHLARKYYPFLRRQRAVFFLIVLFSGTSFVYAGTLQDHLKKITSALTSHNLDSLRLLIDPERIYIEIAPKEGAYLSPSQTLGVVESFFHSHIPVSFSYLLVKEAANTGIAIGTLIVAENGRKLSYKVNFGFEKNKNGIWLLSRIGIK